MHNHDRILEWLSLALEYARKSGIDRLKLLSRIAGFYRGFDPAGRFVEVAEELEKAAMDSPDIESRIEILQELSSNYAATESTSTAIRLIETARSLLDEIPAGWDRDRLATAIAGSARRTGNHALADQLSPPTASLSASTEKLFGKFIGNATDAEAADQAVMEQLDQSLQRCRYHPINGDYHALAKELPELAERFLKFAPEAKRHQDQKGRLVDRLVGLLLEADLDQLATNFADDIRPCSYTSLKMAERFATVEMWDDCHRLIQRCFDRLSSPDDNARRNAHTRTDEFSRVAASQLKIGDHAGALKTADAAGEFISSLTDLSGWRAVAVFSKLAITEHSLGREPNSKRLLSAAEEAAENMRRADPSDKMTAWLSIWKSRMELKDYSGAIEAAKRMPNRESRDKHLAVACVRAGKTSDAEALARHQKTPDESASLCLWVVTHLGIGTG